MKVIHCRDSPHKSRNDATRTKLVRIQRKAPTLKTDGTDAGEHYVSLYQNEFQEEIEWLEIGAQEKADSIEYLLVVGGIRNNISVVCDVGCGPGSVLEECRKRGIGSRHIGIDYSAAVIEYCRARYPTIEALSADILEPATRPPTRPDLVFLSHVLEHFENPGGALAALTEWDFDWLIIEVPLEGLLAGRLKGLLRDLRTNKAGHLQFFSVKDVDALLEKNGFRIVKRRRYVPTHKRATFSFLAQKDDWSRMKHLQSAITGRYLPILLKPLWKRLYYAHYALLVQKIS